MPKSPPALLGAGLALVLSCAAGSAQDVVVPTAGPLHGAPPVVVQPNCPAPLPGLSPSPAPAPGQAPAPAQAPDVFPSPANPVEVSQARGTEAAGTLAPVLMGDAGAHNLAVASHPYVLRVPLATFNAAKITENESAMPLDRVFATFNYYDRLNVPGDVQQGIHANLYRETVGFEKTCLDGAASVGVRAPFFQTTNSAGTLDGSDFGDLDVILKYALYRNRDTGDVLSAGLVVTLPTGPDVALANGSKLDSTLLQPFIGYLFNAGALYVEGFSAVIVPTDGREATLLTTDLGVGYRLYSDCEKLISSVTPAVELHLTDPLSHRGLNQTATGSDVGFPDILVLTSGTHIGIGRLGTLSVGGAIPLTGPKPFNYEAIVEFNLRF